MSPQHSGEVTSIPTQYMIDMNIQLPSDCPSAEELYDLIPLQAAQWTYILLSVSSVILVVYTARNYLNRTIFENVTKELIIFLYFFIAMYSISLIFTQGSQLAYRYTAQTKCDAQVPRIWCLPRYINTVIVCPLLVLHIGITVQHALSTFRFSQRAQKIAVRATILISFAWPILLGVFAYWKESLLGRVPYCSSITANNLVLFNVTLYFLLGLDIVNVFVSLALWRYNHHRLANDHTFDLKQSFHRRQNLYAMQQFLPIATAHGLIYGIFIVATYTSRLFKALLTPGEAIMTTLIANVMPVYCFLCPLMLLVLIRRGRFERIARVKNLLDTEQKQNNVYFNALKDQWK